MGNPRTEFERTYCSCGECSQWCGRMPGMLIPGDAERIAKFYKVHVAEIENRALAASPGAVVGRMEGGQLVKYRIPTIVPRQLDSGKCVFVDEFGMCKVYPVAPYGCAYFDAHMTGPEGDARSRAGLIAIIESPEYGLMWQRLAEAGRTSASPEQKRKSDFAAVRTAPV